MRIAALTPAELAATVHAPPPPRRLVEGCPEVTRMLAVSSSSSASSHERAIKNTIPLGVDEIAIYRAVLGRRLSQGWTSLNVSVTTYPLDATSTGLSNCQCLQGISLESLSPAFRSFHNLTREVLPGKNVRLVDRNRQAATVRANDPDRTMRRGKTVEDAVRDAFETGLFSMSEIAFDREHHYAVVSYGYWCGALCGSGATLVFEKIGGQWKRTDRECGSWIS